MSGGHGLIQVPASGSGRGSAKLSATTTEQSVALEGDAVLLDIPSSSDSRVHIGWATGLEDYSDDADDASFSLPAGQNVAVVIPDGSATLYYMTESGTATMYAQPVSIVDRV